MKSLPIKIKKILCISIFIYLLYSFVLTLIGVGFSFSLKFDDKYYLYGVIIILLIDCIIISIYEFKKVIRRLKRFHVL
ncbi:MAG: hypothetical protein GY756_08895 [bacterium]|nr:hypothetical protein [bacterium]